ncbi:MAG: DUF63 domain-containing protein, partial [Halobacteria archaeon]|nr:DUF63 domain-containing protein [Halobacteria archaeon]
LGFYEQTPLSRRILDFASTLPTAEYLGSGWLFIAVKLFLVVVVIWQFRNYVEMRPEKGYVALGFIAAVGLGPGIHNLLLTVAA